MRHLTETNATLDEIVQYEEKDFTKFYNVIATYSDGETPILNILKLIREVVINNKPGSNVLKYLLCHLRNTIITAQISKEPNPLVSNLYLKNGTLIFDETPFAANLIKSKEPLRFVFDCVDDENAECQLLARRISNISNQTGQLYIKNDLIYQGDDLDRLINDFNEMLPNISSSLYRRVQRFNDYLFIQENETNAYRVLKSLLSKTRSGVSGYQNQATQWVIANGGAIKGEEKKVVLQNMFTSSRVYVLYGAAGTGKSTTVSFIFQMLRNVSKLCLAATHPAVENMKRKIKDQAAEYMTIQKFLYDETIRRDWDIIVIDECSVVSNRDMLKLLEIVNCSVLLLTGDIYQLPSIDFGNWFHIAKYVLPPHAVGELKQQFRTDDNVILELWQKVRQFDESIYEYLSFHSMTVNKIDETIFEKMDDDQIILCYNYDGLYGINSINKYLQSKNENNSVYWKQYVFKVDDPVVFSNTSRFSGVLFNNLKGKIVKIVKEEKSITFDVAVDMPLSEINLRGNQAKFVESLDDGCTVIRFTVYDYEKERDEEPQEMHTIPFQIAYAVSIHKSQGLEYNAVKIIIANNVDELITHNVFYTAITRAKKQIKIYWTPETANKVLSSFEPHFDSKDGAIVKNKYHL